MKYLHLFTIFGSLGFGQLAKPRIVNTREWLAPVKLDNAVNTTGHEDSVHISPGGNKLYFMYAAKDLLLWQIHGQYRMAGPARGMSNPDGVDIFEAVRVNGVWQAATILDAPVNDPDLAECCLWVSDDDTRMYYNRTGASGVSVANKIAGIWQVPVDQLPFQGGDENLSLLPDLSAAFFDAESRGGTGGKDLFIVAHNPFTMEWGTPVNLGPSLNTPWHEHAPVSSRDGNTLYFSDYGYSGIYRSQRNADWTWTPRQQIVSGPCGEPSLTATGDLYFVCVDVLKDASGSVTGYDGNIWHAKKR
jgi:hypothetical protein